MTERRVQLPNDFTPILNAVASRSSKLAPFRAYRSFEAIVQMQNTHDRQRLKSLSEEL
jgi:hypothetical protein